MISHFMMFSGVIVLNCAGTRTAALGSFSSICVAFNAAPIVKSFLNASLREGSPVDDETFLR